MFLETLRLKSPTGADMAYHHVTATEPARGILLILHGLAEHSKRYVRFADAMAARGYHVYAHDHRGHGETLAPDAPLGQFARRDGVTAVLRDVVAMRDAAVARYPGLPVILFGHSMGGLISLNTAVTYPDKFDAVTVWNSNFNPAIAGRFAQLILRVERMLKGSDVPSSLLPKLTFGMWAKSVANRKTDFDWLSHDPAEVDTYVADPFCGFDASVSLWQDIFALSYRAPQMAYLEKLNPSLPFHLVGGGEDPATEGGKAIVWLSKRLKKAAFSHITTRIYQTMRHETLNEVGASDAIADFVMWCDGITTPPQ